MINCKGKFAKNLNSDKDFPKTISDYQVIIIRFNYYSLLIKIVVKSVSITFTKWNYEPGLQMYFWNSCKNKIIFEP